MEPSINNKMTEGECPRYSELETQDNVFKQNKTKDLRRKFITETVKALLKEKMKELKKWHI